MSESFIRRVGDGSRIGEKKTACSQIPVNNMRGKIAFIHKLFIPSPIAHGRPGFGSTALPLQDFDSGRKSERIAQPTGLARARTSPSCLAERHVSFCAWQKPAGRRVE